MSGKIHVGTSGWHYQHWRGPFYPEVRHRDPIGWAGAFATWARQGRDVYCYFDNDEQGYAVQNAIALEEMTGR